VNKFTARGLFKFCLLLYNLSSGIIKQMKLSQRKLTLLVFSILCIASFAFFVMAQENPSNDKNIFLDSDQDGLSDVEEKTYGTDPNNADTDGDGYTDGNEVKAGYDPLRPAPGDKIVADKVQVVNNTEQKDSGAQGNMTQDLSVEVANLISQKSGENQEITIDDLDALVQKTNNETLTLADLPDVDEKDIKIKKQNYSKLKDDDRKAKEKEDATEYLVAMSYIFANNSPQKITKVDDLQLFTNNISSQLEKFSTNPMDISYFSDLASKGEGILEQIKNVEVPESLLDLHINGIKLARYAVSLKDTAKPDSSDPVALIGNLSKVQGLMNLSIEFSDKLNQKMTDLGITDIPVDL
jgi:hypothetical protein